MKLWENQVQATEPKNEGEAAVEEEAVTKDVKDEVGASTSQHTYHQFGTSREKKMISKRT